MKEGRGIKVILVLGLLLVFTLGASAQAMDPSAGKLPLVSQPVTLRFTTHSGTNAAMAPASNDLPLYQYLEKLTGVHIEWEVIPYNTYKDVMTTRLAAGADLPDILNLTNLGNYQKLASDGIIIPQNALLARYGYWVKQFFDKNPAYKAMMTAPDGNIYCIEDTVLDSHLPIMPMVDVYALKRVGLNMPATTTDFENMLKAFKTKDKQDVPFATFFTANEPNYIYQLANAFGLEMTWGNASDPSNLFRVVNGKMQCQFQQPEFKAFLTWINKLYTEGLINKDLTTADYNKLIEYVSKGQAGVVSYWSSYTYLFGGASPDNQGDKDGVKAAIYTPMPPLKTTAGATGYYTKRLSLNGDGMGITTKATPDKQAAAMKWIDFLFNGPESLFAQGNGVEGLSYTKNADGTITKKSPAGMEWSAYVTSIGGNQPPRAHQQLMAVWRSWMPPWLEDVDTSLQRYYRDPSIVTIQWTADEQSALNAKLTDLNTYIMESVTKFILGQTPISQFDTFASELNKRGLPDIQKLFEQRYQRQIKILGK
jgi:putative aldouronate transport system substrate-binding protein